MEQEITSLEQVTETWGSSFEKLVGHPKVHFFPDFINVDLKSSVRLVEGGETKVLKIVEPTTGDLRAMDGIKGDIAKAIALLSTVGGVPVSEINKTKVSDFTLLQQVIDGFLDDVPQTSGT